MSTPTTTDVAAMRAEVDDIIRHSLGLTQARSPYRNHYCSEPTPALLDAVERGLMTGPHDPGWTAAPMWYVTDAGALHVGSRLVA